MARQLGELLEQIADDHGWQRVARDVMADRVHLFVRVGPTDAPAQVVRVSGGRTAQVLRCEFRHLGHTATVLWAPSCLAASVGYAWESTVRPSIEHRWDAVAS